MKAVWEEGFEVEHHSGEHWEVKGGEWMGATRKGAHLQGRGELGCAEAPRVSLGARTPSP